MRSRLHRLRTAKSATLIVTLLAVLASAGALALAKSGPSTPTITSGPANPTALTSASFSFTESQSKVTFQCQLDAAPWASCVTPVSYSNLSTGSHTFQVRSLDSTGAASSPASYPWQIAQTSNKSFSITGNVTASLYPGVSQPIAITLTNPNNSTIYVTGLTVNLDATTLPSGCSGTNFVITQATIPSTGIQVASGATGVSLPAQGATAPSIAMINATTNQDACKRAHFTLDFSGAAHS